MERYFLIVSTFCFLVAVVHTVIEVRTGVFRPKRFNFLAIGLGFVFQTAFLWMRGQALGRCPITNLFEVFVFLAWSVALIYMPRRGTFAGLSTPENASLFAIK